MALESLPGENRSPRSRLMTNQVREWRRNQSRGKRIPEAGRWDTRRNRNRLQGKLLLHRPRRQRPHRQLGRRRERIPSHRWSPAHSATDARTRRQASGWLESRWCPRISHNWFQDDPSTSPPICFYDFLLINNIRWIYFYFVSRIHLFFFPFRICGSSFTNGTLIRRWCFTTRSACFQPWPERFIQFLLWYSALWMRFGWLRRWSAPSPSWSITTGENVERRPSLLSFTFD